MRCGCPVCGAFMVHEESGVRLGCVCPDCLYRCEACLGTDTVVSKEELALLKEGLGPLSALAMDDPEAAPPDDWEE